MAQGDLGRVVYIYVSDIAINSTVIIAKCVGLVLVIVARSENNCEVEKGDLFARLRLGIC